MKRKILNKKRKHFFFKYFFCKITLFNNLLPDWGASQSRGSYNLWGNSSITCLCMLYESLNIFSIWMRHKDSGIEKLFVYVICTWFVSVLPNLKVNNNGLKLLMFCISFSINFEFEKIVTEWPPTSKSLNKWQTRVDAGMVFIIQNLWLAAF